jgi:hypothetical protein
MPVPHYDSPMIGRRIAKRTASRRTMALIGGLLAVVGCGAGDPQGLVTPTTMSVAQGQAQDGVVNQPVAILPAVVVQGDGGRPAEGVTVVFGVASGGGVVLGDTVTTNGEGLGQVGNWILGSSEGPNTLVAEVGGLDPVTFSATASLSLFRIVVRVVAGNPTTSQRNLFSRAASRWGTLITGDLPDVVLNRPSSACHPAISETVDDLLIVVEVLPIDGDRGSLAFGGPCLVRNDSNLPVVGRIRIDDADLGRVEANGTLEAVVLHEMAHVLGLGTELWLLAGLLRDASLPPSNGVDPHFIGPQAIAAFDVAGGIDYAGAKVPVADVGGAGSQDSHWRESVMQTELMTPVVTAGTNPLSAITLGSLADMGYTVDPEVVDGYTVPLATLRTWQAGERLERDVQADPIIRVDRNGM